MLTTFRLMAGVLLLAVVASCGPSKFKTYNGPPVTQIVVEKGDRQMFLLSGRTVLKAYDIGLGFQPIGHKMYEGDGRTPEGVYYINRMNPDSQYHLSLGISYPDPEDTARAMMLMGAEILFYPTAIGNEPHDPSLDTSRLWRRAMVGHAVSNVVPVVAANRIGTERDMTFYGHSFICDERGDMLAEFGATETGVLTATLDLDRVKRHRAAFGFFRDRRPELYGRLVQDI